MKEGRLKGRQKAQLWKHPKPEVQRIVKFSFQSERLWQRLQVIAIVTEYPVVNLRQGRRCRTRFHTRNWRSDYSKTDSVKKLQVTLILLPHSRLNLTVHFFNTSILIKQWNILFLYQGSKHNLFFSFAQIDPTCSYPLSPNRPSSHSEKLWRTNKGKKTENVSGDVSFFFVMVSWIFDSL